MEDNRVKVRIYGQDYIISGERDEETIREIAAFVDSSIREARRAHWQFWPRSISPMNSLRPVKKLPR